MGWRRFLGGAMLSAFPISMAAILFAVGGLEVVLWWAGTCLGMIAWAAIAVALLKAPRP